MLFWTWRSISSITEEAAWYPGSHGPCRMPVLITEGYTVPLPDVSALFSRGDVSLSGLL